MNKIKRYGWCPDKPDIRDLHAKPPIAGITFPETTDLRVGFPHCYDQEQLGSCTANAIAAVLEFDMRKQHEQRVSTPSRLFIYYNERAMEGTINSDAGAEIRDGIKSVNSLGAPAEKYWPYDIDKFAEKPSDEAYQHALLHQTVKYERLDHTNIDNLKACLVQGYPFVFGFSVYEYFESQEMATTGILKMPGSSERIVGGHAVVGVGYDNPKQMVIVRNSWGVDWGRHGYFYMPFDYIVNRNLAADFWVVQQVE